MIKYEMIPMYIKEERRYHADSLLSGDVSGFIF
jgi:hypothetical protein